MVGPATAAAQEATGPARQAPERPATGKTLAQRLDELAPAYRQWLAAVSGLITGDELEYFLALTQDYQRDAFMEAFWEPRDPEPMTRRNELRDRWQQVRDEAGGLPLDDPRFILYLLNGPPGAYSLPDGRPVARCFSKTRELEIWFYGGSERTNRRFPVIFYRRSAGVPYQVYRPGDAVRPIQRSGGLPTTDIQALCADELLRYAAGEITRLGGYQQLIDEILTPPRPSPEWLSNLSLATTKLPEGAATIAVRAEIDFPARRQSRTAVRVLLAVPVGEAPGRRFDDRPFHNFDVAGEVIRDGRLFESFRYRFEGETPQGAEAIPLGFTRYLRPGPLTLRLLLQDVFSGLYAQVVRELTVPSPEGLPEDPGESLLAVLGGPPAAAGAPVGPSLRLNAPPGAGLAGPVRFTARAEGELDKVTFFLDERPVFTLRRPPWSAELNLGPSPAPHRVRVVGFVGERQVASDEIWLNQGAARFRVRLIEPRSGGIYPGSLTARVEVETPDGQRPERVELYVGEELRATFTEPPLSTVLRLSGAEPAVVRAVAYLPGGGSAEDAVLVNAAGPTEVVDVRLVEIPVLVVDGRGEPILDLAMNDFRLTDEGRPQTLQRLVGPGQAPLQAALLIDTSASMQDSLREVTAAATRFVGAALASPEVGLAVLSFADRLRAETGFGDRPAELERALAGLVARGETTLWDSIAEAAASFGEAPGQRALVLFTDGADEGSATDLAGAVAAAQRQRVSVFVIAPAGSFADRQARREVERLAEQTGGQSWMIDGLDGLGEIYAAIAAQLRVRYLLAYTAPADGGDGYRRLRVEVERAGASVRAPDGYYP